MQIRSDRVDRYNFGHLLKTLKRPHKPRWMTGHNTFYTGWTRDGGPHLITAASLEGKGFCKFKKELPQHLIHAGALLFVSPFRLRDRGIKFFDSPWTTHAVLMRCPRCSVPSRRPDGAGYIAPPDRRSFTAQGQVHGHGAPSTWCSFVAPTMGAVTFVSNHAREISVMVTPCLSASSTTRSMMALSCSAVASYLRWA